jgi:hypothetical protein
MTVRTRGSTWESLDLLMRCRPQDMGTALWWATLAHHLGELAEELALTDVTGLAAQITTDAPHFAAAARRLPPIHEQAQRDAARLRQAATDQSGSPTAARDLCNAVDALLGRVRTLHRLSSDLMLDAYERDIGGD